MLNVIETLLDPSRIDERHFWLLCHIAKRLGSDGSFPKNSTLVKDTGWNIKKVQRIKKDLINKGLVDPEARFLPDGRQTSNRYHVKTREIGVYITADRISDNEIKSDPLPQNGTPAPSQNGTPPPPQNGTPLEVLEKGSITQSNEEAKPPPTEKKKKATKKTAANKGQQEVAAGKRIFDKFHEKLVGFSMDWNGKEGAQLKRLIGYIKQRVARQTQTDIREIDLKTTLDSFSDFLELVMNMKDPFFRDKHFTPSGLVSQWQKIIQRLILEHNEQRERNSQLANDLDSFI